MRRIRRKLPYIAIYAIIWVGNWGAMLGSSYIFDYSDARGYRRVLGASGVASLFPPVWILTAAVGGFYADGWMAPWAGYEATRKHLESARNAK